MIGQGKFDAPNNEMVYGKGGFSDKILSFSPADAILSLGLALDLQKFIKYAEKEILPEFGDDIKLDEPVDELGGLSIRDAINAFTGEFLISLTDVKMPDPSSMGGFPVALEVQTMEVTRLVGLKVTFHSQHLVALVDSLAEVHLRV